MITVKQKKFSLNNDEVFNSIGLNLNNKEFY